MTSKPQMTRITQIKKKDKAGFFPAGAGLLSNGQLIMC